MQGIYIPHNTRSTISGGTKLIKYGWRMSCLLHKNFKNYVNTLLTMYISTNMETSEKNLFYITTSDIFVKTSIHYHEQFSRSNKI